MTDNDLDYGELMDLEYEKRVELETDKQRELRHLFLDGKPAEAIIFTPAGFLQTEGRWSEEASGFIFKQDDIYHVYYALKVQNVLVVMGVKRVLGQVNLKLQ